MKKAENISVFKEVVATIKNGKAYDLDQLFNIARNEGGTEFLIEMLSFFLNLTDPQAEQTVASLLGEVMNIFEREHMHERVYSASVKLAQNYAQNRIPEAQRVSEKVLEIIENEFSDEKLSLFRIAHRLNISHGHLSTLIKKTLGRNFKELLTERRMTKAHEMTVTTNLKILQIAKECGYSDQYHFSFAFKKYYGISPQRLREKTQHSSAPD